MSSDGRYVAFASAADNLVAGDTTHTLVIERSGAKNRRAKGYQVGLDAIEVVGTLK